jgi:soluble lytic murein transglycosylase-like protein
MTRRALALCSLILLACSPWARADDAAEDAEDLARWTRKYDHHFQKYSKHYFGPHFDWTWFKAQAIAESRLDPTAHSPAGARGLMQIMPATFGEIRRANPHFDDIRSPKWNIAAGIYYNRYLFERWDRFGPPQRLYFTFASYNAGLAGIRGATRRAREPVRGWHEVEPHAPAQTRHYVRRIQRLKTREVALQQQTRGAARVLARAGDPPPDSVPQ